MSNSNHLPLDIHVLFQSFYHRLSLTLAIFNIFSFSLRIQDSGVQLYLHVNIHNPKGLAIGILLDVNLPTMYFYSNIIINFFQDGSEGFL